MFRAFGAWLFLYPKLVLARHVTSWQIKILILSGHTRLFGIMILYTLIGGVTLKGYRKYFFNKLGWFVITFVFAFI